MPSPTSCLQIKRIGLPSSMAAPAVSPAPVVQPMKRPFVWISPEKSAEIRRACIEDKLAGDQAAAQLARNTAMPTVVAPYDCQAMKAYVTGGAARVELVWTETGEAAEFAISRHRSDCGQGHVYFVRALMPGCREYVGMMSDSRIGFKASKADNVQDLAGRFGAWWQGVFRNEPLSGVRASTVDMRLAATASERKARKLSERAARLSAAVSDAAAKEGGHTPSPGAMKAIQAGLRRLTELDPDRASRRNQVGFSKVDSYFGAHLAGLDALSPDEAIVGRSLVWRYRAQIGDDLVAVALDRVPTARRWTERDVDHEWPDVDQRQDEEVLAYA